MSKKERAFELFRQGKKPSDPELKALGLKNKTVYAYYEDFKRKEYGAPVEETAIDDDELTELKREKVRLSLLSQIEELEAKREKLAEKIERLEKRLQALIEYLEEILPVLETVASIGANVAVLHYFGVHQASQEDMDRWPAAQEVNKAIETLNRVGPIAEKLRKIKRGD